MGPRDLGRWLDEEDLARPNPELEELAIESSLPGLSAAIVHEGKVAWSVGIGLADIENGVLAEPDTRTADLGGVLGICDSINPTHGQPFDCRVLGVVLEFPYLGERIGVPARAGEHRQGRSVQARVPEDQPQQPHARHRRSRRGR